MEEKREEESLRRMNVSFIISSQPERDGGYGGCGIEHSQVDRYVVVLDMVVNVGD